jgi:hypothetical protein
MKTQNIPKIGMTYTVYGVQCKIYKILSPGTIHVEAMDGSERCWQVTGLPFITQEAR